ncbi:MAG: hypothetical protein ACE5FH_13205, partial [Candidatus Zixiibacteriota bacterium]
MAQLNLLTDVEMLAELRRLLDEQTSADSTWDDTDLYSWLTRSNLRHFKMMLRADDNWFMATTTLTTSAQTVNYEDFTVPTDMYKVLRLWRMDDNDNTTKNYLVPVIRPINESPRGTFFGRPDIGYYQHNDGTDRKLRLV